MELRNRNLGGRRDIDGRLTDVSLGPTIYAGERYSKASERLKRQQKNGINVDGVADRMLAPRFFGYIFAVVVMFAVVFYLMFMSGGKKRKSRGV
ncbi:hypothetical protein Gpo141_00001546 [Globisporangium polare]